MKKITIGIIILLALSIVVGTIWKVKNETMPRVANVKKAKDTSSFTYGELSWYDIMMMDSIEKRRFYLALTDSLPDLWTIKEINKTSYAIEDSIPSLPENDIIHMIYRQRVNGYQAKIAFDRTSDQMRGQEGYSLYMGHAILFFSKPNHTFQVYCEDFSDEQLKVWDLTNSDYYLKSATIIQYTIKGRFMSR